MAKEADTNNDKLFCKECDELVVPVKKMFGTLLCPNCGVIVGGKYSIDEFNQPGSGNGRAVANH